MKIAGALVDGFSMSQLASSLKSSTNAMGSRYKILITTFDAVVNWKAKLNQLLESARNSTVARVRVHPWLGVMETSSLPSSVHATARRKAGALPRLTRPPHCPPPSPPLSERRPSSP